jgi:hypothetical protein
METPSFLSPKPAFGLDVGKSTSTLCVIGPLWVRNTWRGTDGGMDLL